jgi:hypothetical protein
MMSIIRSGGSCNPDPVDNGSTPSGIMAVKHPEHPLVRCQLTVFSTEWFNQTYTLLPSAHASTKATSATLEMMPSLKRKPKDSAFRSMGVQRNVNQCTPFTASETFASTGTLDAISSQCP